MKNNETWFEFMDRAKKNGVSPTMQESIDKCETKGENCIVCGTFVEGFESKGCCDGHECGCMGMPIEPCICSKECWEASGIGKRTSDTVTVVLEEGTGYFPKTTIDH